MKCATFFALVLVCGVSAEKYPPGVDSGFLGNLSNVPNFLVNLHRPTQSNAEIAASMDRLAAAENAEASASRADYASQRQRMLNLERARIHHMVHSAASFLEVRGNGIGDAAAAISAETNKYVSQSSAQDEQRIAAVTRISENFAHEAAAIENEKNALASDAYALAANYLRKQKYIGGCVRNYSACPDGFSGDGNSCAPTAEYAGSCSKTDFSGMSTSDKENWAVDCSAGFSCQNSAPSYSGCPNGFSNQGNMCVPSSYSGICGAFPVSIENKGEFGALCDFTWPSN